MNHDDKGRFAKGNRASRGRPQLSIKAALRRCGDPQELALALWKMATTSPSETTRIAAIGMIFDRLEGKSVSRSDMRLQAVSVSLPDHWDLMSRGERATFANELRARAVAGQLDAGDEDDGD